MPFCLLVSWKVTAGSCRQMKRLSHCWVSKLAVLFLWSVSGQPCCVQMQPQQMTWLFYFQWWTAVDLWGYVVLVTISFFAYVVLVKESVSGDKAFLDYCSKLSFLSLHFWWPFSREGHKPCWGKYYRRKSSPARVVLPLFPYSEAC